MVPVTERGGLFLSFDRNGIRVYDDRRAPGAHYKKIDGTGYEGRPYKLHSRGLIQEIPVERWDEAKTIGVDLGPIASNELTEAEMLALENEQATLLTDPAKYNSNNTEVLSGTSQWSDSSSTPSVDVRSWISAISAQIGKSPNVALLGYDVYQALQDHPAILDRIKYTSRDSITAEMLAQLWNIEKVVIGEAVVEDNTGQVSRVWGKNVILARVNPAGLASGKIPFSSMMSAKKITPSFAYTYVERDSPKISNPWFTEENDCYNYKIKFDRDSDIVGVDDNGLGTYGFLARSVVA